MIISAKTDLGKFRKMNQDYIIVEKENSEYVVCILADGMGGYIGGEIASSLAAESASEYLKENFTQVEHTKESLQKLVRASMDYANGIVYEKAKEETDLEKMGTTLEVCLICDERAYIGHIGDSRIYRLRKGIFRKLTTDHSYVQKLVKDGTITPEEAVNHPKKNMLIKALGCDAILEPDIMVRGFQKEDILLMCSDGLTNMLNDDIIQKIIESNVENSADNLIIKANEFGGLDNISAIIIKNNGGKK